MTLRIPAVQSQSNWCIPRPVFPAFVSFRCHSAAHWYTPGLSFGHLWTSLDPLGLWLSLTWLGSTPLDLTWLFPAFAFAISGNPCPAGLVTPRLGFALSRPVEPSGGLLDRSPTLLVVASPVSGSQNSPRT
ncbi:hypothetical protein M404DRAFT_30167 [Pisolithus tinctorius Marx 270]|uniref:Uncharacterized protein n=1 Tax=Pisolithus tinctorius Marx 270 TaxID=870435 RepID=A0A0C3JQD9_PISTI|nr:hypothetical protein M404DRAFT_30167 [Pisolithus tinctorius Marx 270]